jgi:molecular chaperone GrpE
MDQNVDKTPEAEDISSGESTLTELSPLEARIQTLEAELKEEKNKFLYLYADFENHKKRVVKERSDLLKFGWEKVARDLLPVMDNLERAVEFMPESTDKNLKQGIEMVLSQFRGTLEKQGVSIITTENQDFNPEIHEAMTQEPSPLPSGKITRSLEKGYLLHGRLLRAAKVVISLGTPGA